MINERPVDDPKLQTALNEIRAIMERHDFPGAVMLVAPEEAVFSYKMDATWSALRRDRGTPLGFRLRAISGEIGKRETERRVEGAMHTICQLSDFGFQTQEWMEDIKLMARRAGIDFDHTPFGGRPLQHLITDLFKPPASTSAATVSEPTAKIPQSEPQTATQPQLNPISDEVIDEISLKLIDQGLLLEAGFLSLRKMAIPEDAPPNQVDNMRMAFFAGAQHVFNSIIRMMEPDAEPTENDMRRMDAINQELEGFIAGFKATHGL